MSISLQPSYFTSSLFVDCLREDILSLVHQYVAEYLQFVPEQPFTLFKTIWSRGWMWLHLKVFEPRAREAFIRVTLRLFTERLSPAEAPLTRVIALFAAYTFFASQPISSTPPLYRAKSIAIPIDMYLSLLDLPSALGTPHLVRLQPHTTHIISTLVAQHAFHILPATDLYPLNPRTLPREVFRPDGYVDPNEAEVPKKKGRPSKREKLKRSKDALSALDRWLDKNSQSQSVSAAPEFSAHPGAAAVHTTHALLTNPPTLSRQDYRTQKLQLLNRIDSSPHTTAPSAAVVRANEAVLARLRKIDEMAAAKGLEVGGEGGERTGLQRVERAVHELGIFGEQGTAAGRRGGILGLLDGAGIEDGDRRKLPSPETSPVDYACLANAGHAMPTASGSGTASHPLDSPPAIVITGAAIDLTQSPAPKAHIDATLATNALPNIVQLPQPQAMVIYTPGADASVSAATTTADEPTSSDAPSIHFALEAPTTSIMQVENTSQLVGKAPSEEPPIEPLPVPSEDMDVGISELISDPSASDGIPFDLSLFGSELTDDFHAHPEGDIPPISAVELEALLATIPEPTSTHEDEEMDAFTQLITEASAAQQQAEFNEASSMMEVDAIAEAAAEGVATEDSEMYSTEAMEKFFDDGQNFFNTGENSTVLPREPHT